MKYLIGTLISAVASVSFGWADENPAESITPDDFVPPEFVYIPGDGYKADLVIEVSDDISVGSPARVSARAYAGPWRKVRYSDIEPCSTWYIRPMEETDLTHSVEWTTDPPGVARFGTVTQMNVDGSFKEIRFARPGEFQLSASTTFPTKVTSNTTTVKVGQ